MRAAALALVLVGSQFASSDEAKDKAVKELEGEWEFVTVEGNGEKMDLKTFPKSVTIKDGVLRTSDPKVEWDGIRLTLDATANPRSMDFTKVDAKGKPVGGRDPSPGIYKIEKDELTICVVVGPGTKRPKEFKTGPGTGLDLDLMTLRRVKN